MGRGGVVGWVGLGCYDPDPDPNDKIGYVRQNRDAGGIEEAKG